MAIDANEQTFEAEVVKSPVPVLVDFWAPWCGPCRMLSPILEEIGKEGKIKVVKVNVDENQKLSTHYGVSSIPTMVVFRDGKPAEGKVGAGSKESIEAWIDSVLAK